MATADQVKSLIKAHIEQDDERFKTITLQIAANEARHGHDTFARELKQYAEKIGKGKKNLIRLNNNGNGMFSSPILLSDFRIWLFPRKFKNG